MIPEAQDPTTGTLYQKTPNYSKTLLASAGYATSYTSADLTNPNCRGIAVILDVTNANGGSIIVTVKGKDPTSGKYYTLLAGAAVTTNSTNVYRVNASIIQEWIPGRWCSEG